MPGERRLFELWHYGTKRCRMTPADGDAPYVVMLYDEQKLIAEWVFDDHQSACAYAVDELRRATTLS